MVRPVASPRTSSGLARTRAAISRQVSSATASGLVRMITSIACLDWLKELAQVILAGQHLATLEDIVKLAILPAAQPVESREGELRRRSSLTADQLRSTPHVVDHPRRQAEVVGVACN